MDASVCKKQTNAATRGLMAAGLLFLAATGCGRAETPPPAAATPPPAADAPPPAAAAAWVSAPVAAAATEQAGTAAKASSLVELRRQFYAFEQRFRAEDEVCAALTATNAVMRLMIASNEAVIYSRLQADPEWSRIRNALAEAQQAGDRTRMQMAAQRRGEALTNAIRRNVIMMRSGVSNTPAASPHGR